MSGNILKERVSPRRVDGAARRKFVPNLVASWSGPITNERILNSSGIRSI